MQTQKEREGRRIASLGPKIEAVLSTAEEGGGQGALWKKKGRGECTYMCKRPFPLFSSIKF